VVSQRRDTTRRRPTVAATLTARDDAAMSDLAADASDDLETGCRASTPDGDNLVMDFARGEVRAYTTIAAANGGRCTNIAELDLHTSDLGIASPFGNTAHLGRPLTDADRPALVDALRSELGAHPGGPYLVFSAWPTPDLRSDGFLPVGHPPLMFRPPGATPPRPPALDIVQVHDTETLADFERTLIEAYPVAEMQPVVPQSFLHPDVLATDWRLFVGYLDGRPVATAGAFVTPAMTMVELVSARPETRRSGIGTALTAAATTTEPDRPALLIASDLGRGAYERLGYLPLLRYTLWLGLR
jgi:GNAT superfamily N-acetyltransferase